MGYKGGPCWWCGEDLSKLTQDSEEFTAHMMMNCPDKNKMWAYMGDDELPAEWEEENERQARMPRKSNPCGRYNQVEGRRYTCWQKTHPSGVHNGKSWNTSTRQYDFLTWDVKGK